VTPRTEDEQEERMQVHDEATHALAPAAAASRANRDAALDALRDLEDALAAPTPGREERWLHAVVNAVDRLTEALGTQAGDDAETASLLSEIAVEEPHLKPRIDRLRQEHHDLRAAAASIRDQITPATGVGIDTADIRDRLASVARRARQHRAREADLIYAAVNINLGVGD
jgi:hypothetical protein